MSLPRLVRDAIASLARGQHRPQAKFIGEMMLGMLSGQRPQLMTVAEAIEPENVAACEKRLSRNLNSDRFDEEEFERQWFDLAASHMRPETGEDLVVAVDTSDIYKPYASLTKGMEGVERCYHGALKDPEEKKHGVGYTTVQIDVSTSGRTSFPLLWRPFSLRSSTVKGDSQPSQVARALRQAAAVVPKDAIWVFDRGFDGAPTFDVLDELGLRAVVRLNTEHRARLVQDMERSDIVTVDVVASRVGRWWSFEEKSGRGRTEHTIRGRIGVAQVRRCHSKVGKGDARAVGPARTLVVCEVEGFDRPLLLLSSLVVTDRAGALRVRSAYRRRWCAELTNRCLKETKGWGMDLNAMQPLFLRGVRRLAYFAMVLTAVAAWWMAEAADEVVAKARGFCMGRLPLVDWRGRVLRVLRSTVLSLARRVRLRAEAVRMVTPVDR